MDKNKLKKLYSHALNSSYHNKFEIIKFIVLPTYDFDVDKSKWVRVSYSLFLSLKKSSDYMENDEWREINEFLERIFGYECVVDFE